MIATLDIGNTKSKFCIWESQKPKEYGFWENKIPKALMKCERWIVSNVSGIKIELPSSIKILSVNSTIHLPYTLLYNTPHTLGSDRLASVAGAVFEGYKNAIVIDCGTCIKIEVLKDLNYLGGSISPGLFMKAQSLKEHTGKLPFVTPEPFKKNYGTSTQESILCGIVQGSGAEIEMRINRIKEEIGECPVIITGGDANLLQNHIKHKIFALPNLLHAGLFKIHTIND